MVEMPGCGSALASSRTRIAVPGPLGPFTVGLRAELTREGFTRQVVAQHTHLLADMSQWLAKHGLSVGDLDEDVLARYLADRRSAGHRVLISPRGMAPTLSYLREVGVVPQAGPPTPGLRPAQAGT
jgi:hypothetical protein